MPVSQIGRGQSLVRARFVQTKNRENFKQLKAVVDVRSRPPRSRIRPHSGLFVAMRRRSLRI